MPNEERGHLTTAPPPLNSLQLAVVAIRGCCSSWPYNKSNDDDAVTQRMRVHVDIGRRNRTHWRWRWSVEEGTGAVDSAAAASASAVERLSVECVCASVI